MRSWASRGGRVGVAPTRGRCSFRATSHAWTLAYTPKGRRAAYHRLFIDRMRAICLRQTAATHPQRDGLAAPSPKRRLSVVNPGPPRRPAARGANSAQCNQPRREGSVGTIHASTLSPVGTRWTRAGGCGRDRYEVCPWTSSRGCFCTTSPPSPGTGAVRTGCPYVPAFATLAPHSPRTLSTYVNQYRGTYPGTRAPCPRVR